MAKMTLDRPRLHNPSAPDAAGIALLMVGGRLFAESRRGSVRRYANGRTRLILLAGVTRSVELTVYVSPAGLATLRAWEGVLLLYRDGLGTKMWGTYLGSPAEPNINGSAFEVPLRFTELTHSEEV